MSQASRARVGDLVIVQGPRVGVPSRMGEILEVLGTGEHEHYRVRWDDERESIFTPGSDAVIKHVEHPGDDEPVLIHEP